MTSSIPAVLSGLTAAWTAALPTFGVVKGPIYDSSKSGLLAVGWDRTDQASVIGSVDSEDLRLSGGQETVVVSSLLTVYVDSTFDAAIGDLFAAFDACRAVVVDDPTLGGVVNDAEVGPDYDFTPAITDTGSELVDLRFTTTVHAFI